MPTSSTAIKTQTDAVFTAVRHEPGGRRRRRVLPRIRSHRDRDDHVRPGATNAITPLTEAAQADIPLVLVTGAAPRPARPHDIDQRAMSANAGAAYFEVGTDDAGRIAAEAVTFALAHRTPVVLAIPTTSPTPRHRPRDRRSPSPHPTRCRQRRRSRLPHPCSPPPSDR